MTHEKTWRELTEEDRAEECPTGAAVVWIGGFVLMGLILVGVCFS